MDGLLKELKQSGWGKRIYMQASPEPQYSLGVNSNSNGKAFEILVWEIGESQPVAKCELTLLEAAALSQAISNTLSGIVRDA